MPFQSRQQLIKADRWRTSVVELPEVGPVRLAAPTSGGAMRYREVQKKKEEGARTQVDVMTSMLLEAAVDDEGAALFKEPGAAAAALEGISAESLMVLLNAYLVLATPVKKSEEGAGGNSEAGPSAGSPSASAAS